MVFYRQGPALINLPLIHLSRASLVFGLGRGLKLADLLATSVLFLSTTKVEEFTAGLARLGVPYRVGFAITLAFRLVPLFIDSALTVVQDRTCAATISIAAARWTGSNGMCRC
jgi:energy-coupling factor transporter transmembrane protein EcfT